jgi:hypothetical protein
MAKKRNFKPGDMVQVIADVESEKYKKDDVGLVVPGTMYWPLTKAHANGRRILMHSVLIFGTKHWIDAQALKLIEKANG